MKKVLIGFPSYDGRTQNQHKYVVPQASKSPDVYIRAIDASCSSLTRGFNTLWAEALTQKEAGNCTHFVMFHDDIIPESFWLDKMLMLMDKQKADILSAIVPIKTTEGFTSTAFDESGQDDTPWDHYRIRRLTLKEAFGGYQPTFTAPNLLLNTGLMLVDMSGPWVDHLMTFRFENEILRMPGGELKAHEISEDWYFSRQASARGASLWATREIAVSHIGRFAYPNSAPWGTVETDKKA